LQRRRRQLRLIQPLAEPSTPTPLRLLLRLLLLLLGCLPPEGFIQKLCQPRTQALRLRLLLLLLRLPLLALPLLSGSSRRACHGPYRLLLLLLLPLLLLSTWLLCLGTIPTCILLACHHCGAPLRLLVSLCLILSWSRLRRQLLFQPAGCIQAAPHQHAHTHDAECSALATVQAWRRWQAVQDGLLGGLQPVIHVLLHRIQLGLQPHQQAFHHLLTARQPGYFWQSRRFGEAQGQRRR